MKKTFTLTILILISAISGFAQTTGIDSVVYPDSQYVQCPTSFDIMVLESFPPQYRFIPSRPDSFATFFWDFGDGNWSNEMFPTHVYQFSGKYVVCLSYTSRDSCISYSCDTLLAQGFDNDCMASFNAYRSDANWRDSANTDSLWRMNPPFSFIDQSKGNVIKWKWDFGDGSYSGEQHPAHWFEKPGVYNVCLEILTDNGCTGTYCMEIIADYPSYCIYSGTVKDYTGLDGCGLLILLDNGIILEPAEIVPNFVLRDGQRVMLGYTELTDRASICMMGTIARIDCINEIYDNCVTSFYFYELPWVSSLPPIYQFVIDSGFTISEVFWDFGDGTVSGEYSPTHRFQHDGYYTVCLKVISYDGCTAGYCQSAWFDGYDPQPGLCENYIRLSTDVILNGWNCNGTAAASLVDMSGNPVPARGYLWSTGETSSQIFNLCPGYTYSVTVVDEEGCAVSGSFSFGAPVLYPDSLIGYWNYEQDEMDFVFNLPIFSDSIYCEWDFGDGQTAMGSNVNHTYSSSDNFTVQLKVFDNTGNILYNGEILVSPGSPTGIEYPVSGTPVVYPVPARDWLNIELAGSGTIKMIEIMNAEGRTLNIASNINPSGSKA